MFFLLFFLLILASPFIWRIILERIADTRQRQMTGWIGTLLFTLAYWFWETQAGGNIRIDLLLLYPILFSLYIISFREKLKWWSLFAALTLMVLNILFFTLSYSFFDKSSG